MGFGGSQNPSISCESDLAIRSTGDLARFEALGCKTVKGDLVIGEDDGGSWQGNAASDLGGMASLLQVEGDLVIAGLAIAQLTGLQNLREVGGSLIIENNQNLTGLAALSGLQVIEGDLTIAFNLRLTTLLAGTGWESDLLAGQLTVRNNTLLPQCAVDELSAHLDADCHQPPELYCELLNTGASDCD